MVWFLMYSDVEIFCGWELGQLAGMAQLLGASSPKPKDSGSMPDQSTCPGFEFDPLSGHIQEATYGCFPMISLFLSVP